MWLLVLAGLGLALSGCFECEDGSDPGDDCICDDGTKADECKVKGPGDTPDAGARQEDEAAGRLKESGVKDTAVYGDDAIQADLYGCAHVGDTSDVLCVMDLVGSGFDWVLSGCLLATRGIDDMGREYKASYSIGGAWQTASSCGDKTLVERVKTEARLRFSDVHSGATSFALLGWTLRARTSQMSVMPEEIVFREVDFD
jgi:hypothetical protein